MNDPIVCARCDVSLEFVGGIGEGLRSQPEH
jgi:hypothetical protein